jgi:hypothetical protein
MHLEAMVWENIAHRLSLSSHGHLPQKPVYRML